jgi:hypothetical protein
VPQNSKPDTFVADLERLPPALEILTTQKRWVVWQWMSRTDKNGEVQWTKPPYRPDHPKMKAKSNDPSTWGSYEAAVAAVKAGLADGIGYMLLDSEIAAADLDKCRNVLTSELCDWAQSLVDEAYQIGLYVEVTVSGTGLRFIGTTDKHERLSRRFILDSATKESVELYRHCERYITISGLQQGECNSLPPADDYLAVLMGQLENPAPAPKSGKIDFNAAPKQDLTEYYRDLIENGAPEGQRSEAFAEVIWHLANQGITIEEIEAELRKHPNGIAEKYWKRLTAEISRCYHKWKASQLALAAWRKPAATSASASAGAGSTQASGPGSPWPQIKLVPGELPRVVSEAEEALMLLNEDIFQRGGILVHTARGTTVGADGRLEGWESSNSRSPT